MRQAKAVSIFSLMAVFVVCIVLVPLLPNRAEAQDNICSETTTVFDIDSSRADIKRSFQTTQRSFRVTYDVDFTDDQNNDNAFVLEIRDGSRVVDSSTSTEDDQDSFLVLEQPGTFTIETDVEPNRAAEYEVFIEECTEGDDGSTPADDQYDDGNNDADDGAGDVDDPDDVVLGTGDDDTLVDTGGVPLIFGAAALALSAALLARRILAP